MPWLLSVSAINDDSKGSSLVATSIFVENEELRSTFFGKVLEFLELRSRSVDLQVDAVKEPSGDLIHRGGVLDVRKKPLGTVVLLTVEHDSLVFVEGERVVMVVRLVLHRFVVLFECCDKLIPFIGWNLEIRVNGDGGILAGFHVVIGEAVTVEDKHLSIDVLSKRLQLLQLFRRAMNLQLYLGAQVPRRPSNGCSVVDVFQKALGAVVTLPVVDHSLIVVDGETIVKAIGLLVHAFVEIAESGLELVHFTLLDGEVGVDGHTRVFCPCSGGEVTAQHRRAKSWPGLRDRTHEAGRERKISESDKHGGSES
mmetsp:Transcript_30182/g.56381  ORF Transcript_30182/g.56381 Transcript_30182/m.56381 type:complete len:311 (-) Transcript_30182:29-961(-)